MLFVLAFTEDGTLMLVESATVAAASYDGADIESGTLSLYAADGTPLAAEFIAREPGAERRSAREYRLVPARDSTHDELALALYEARRLVANPWFDNIEDLKSALRTAGVAVDYPAQDHADEA